MRRVSEIRLGSEPRSKVSHATKTSCVAQSDIQQSEAVDCEFVGDEEIVPPDETEPRVNRYPTPMEKKQSLPRKKKTNFPEIIVTMHCQHSTATRMDILVQHADTRSTDQGSCQEEVVSEVSRSRKVVQLDDI